MSAATSRIALNAARALRAALRAGMASVLAMGVNLPALAAPGKTAADGSASVVDLSSLTRLTIGLVVVVGVILAVAFFVRRSGGLGGSVGGQLRVLGAVSVGQRERVVLVKAGKTQLLVGVAPGQVRALHVLDEPLDGTEPDGSATGDGTRGGLFAQRLHQMMRQHEKRQ